MRTSGRREGNLDRLMAASRAAGFALATPEPDAETAETSSAEPSAQASPAQALMLIPATFPSGSTGSTASPQAPRRNDVGEELRASKSPTVRAVALRDFVGLFWSGRAHA